MSAADDQPAAPLVDLDDGDDPDGSSADFRRLVSWVIVAGLVLGAAAAALLVWEAWSANRAALEHNRQAAAGDAHIYGFAPDGAGPAAPSDPGPPAGVEPETSSSS
jgi:hypothetical protein